MNETSTIHMPTEGHLGGFDIRRFIQKHMRVGLAISLAVHALAIGTYYLTVSLTSREVKSTVHLIYIDPANLGQIPSLVNPHNSGSGGGGAAVGGGGGGPKRVNRSQFYNGAHYTGNSMSMASRARKPVPGHPGTDYAPDIGTSQDYDFRPDQLGVNTEPGDLLSLDSLRKGSGESYEPAGLNSVNGKYYLAEEDGPVSMSGIMEIGVTAKLTKEKEKNNAATGSSRDYQSIYDVVSSNRNEIFYCFQSERKRDITLKGNVEMEVTLNQTGRVIEVTFSSKTSWSDPVSGKRVEQCIRNIVGGWNFGMGAGDPSSKTTFNLSFLWT